MLVRYRYTFTSHVQLAVHDFPHKLKPIKSMFHKRAECFRYHDVNVFSNSLLRFRLICIQATEHYIFQIIPKREIILIKVR